MVPAGQPVHVPEQMLHEVGIEAPHSQRELRLAGALPRGSADAPSIARTNRLVRKQSEWYRPVFPDVPDDLPYVWPVPAGKRRRGR